jgi:flagellar protein FliS
MTREDINVYTNRISNANPTQLIVVMYDMAIDYLKSAVRYVDEGSKTEFTAELKRAKRVINQLTSVLDMKYPVSGELKNIYLFMNNAIVRANARYETEELTRCIAMLEKLRAAFFEVSKQDTQTAVMKNTQQLYAGLTYSRNSLNETMSEDYNRGFTV